MNSVITSRWIWDGRTDTVYPGAVTLREGRIDRVARYSPAEAIPLPPTLLTVGLVNAHVHLDLTTERPPGPIEGPFTDWLAHVVTFRKDAGSAGLKDAARRGIAASLAAGVTLLFDFDPAGWCLPALADSPIGRIVGREVISLGPEWATQDAAKQFLETPTPPHELRTLAPHAPYTVHPEVLDRVFESITPRVLPWAIHLAESAWEQTLLESGTGEGAAFLERFGGDPQAFVGKRSMVERLDERGVLDPRALLVHGNHLTDDECDRIAESGAAVAFCPRSFEYFGHQNHPAAKLRDRGVPLLLGTDGAISAGDLNLLEEVRTARRLVPEIEPIEWWRAVTTTPRKLWGDRWGTGLVEPGAKADLVRWDLSEVEGIERWPSEIPAADALRDALAGAKTQGVWIDGRGVVRNRLGENHPER